MQKYSPTWSKWSDTFSRFHISGLVAWILDAGEPFALVGAQFLYLGQPFIGGDQIENLAAFLENREEVRAFAAFLRKE